MPFSKVLNQSLSSKSGKSPIKLPKKEKSQGKSKKTKSEDEENLLAKSEDKSTNKSEDLSCNNKAEEGEKSSNNNKISGKTAKQEQRNDSTNKPKTFFKRPAAVEKDKFSKSTIEDEIIGRKELIEGGGSLDREEGEEAEEGILVTACKEYGGEDIVHLVDALSLEEGLFTELLNETDRSGRSALSHVCGNGDILAASCLMSQPKIQFNQSDKDGNTPLHYAAQAGHLEVVSLLVNKHSRLVEIDARNKRGLTPLMISALQGRTKIAKVLLFAGASPLLRDYGKQFCAAEWAKYTGREQCLEIIESIQRTCSYQLKERWSHDPFATPAGVSDTKGRNSPPGQELYVSMKRSIKNRASIKNKLKKAFHKQDPKKETKNTAGSTIVATLSENQTPGTSTTEETKVPELQITEVTAPDCYYEPEDVEGESESPLHSSSEEAHPYGSNNSSSSGT